MSYEKDKKEETDFEELAQRLESIAKTINSHKAPEQNDIDTCTRILYSLSESLSGDESAAAANACDVLEATQKKMKALFENEKKQKETENELRKEVEQLKQQVKELQIQMKELRDELTKAQTQPLKSIAEHKTNQVLLLAGQTALLFEQSVCWYVFPEVFHGDQTATIKELFLYINGSKGKEVDKNQVKDAKQRWYDLREKLQWPADWDKKETWSKMEKLPDDLFSVSILKKLRVGPAHPKPIRLKSVLEDVGILKEHLSDIKFQKVKKFIETLELRMHDCELSHPALLFD